MKKFEAPELDVMALAVEDVLTASTDCGNDLCPTHIYGEDQTPIT